MAALRTQIYLSPELRARVDEYTRRTHKSLAEVIREALDLYLANASADVTIALDETFGALPELSIPPRAEWDRG